MAVSKRSKNARCRALLRRCTPYALVDPALLIGPQRPRQKSTRVPAQREALAYGPTPMGPKPWRNRPLAVRNTQELLTPPRIEWDPKHHALRRAHPRRLVPLASLRSARCRARFRLSFAVAAVEFWTIPSGSMRLIQFAFRETIDQRRLRPWQRTFADKQQFCIHNS